MLLAEGSEKSAVENQKDILFALKICKANLISCEICQCEVRGWSVKFDAIDHVQITRMMPKIISTTRLTTFDWTTDLSVNMETARTTPIPR